MKKSLVLLTATMITTGAIAATNTSTTSTASSKKSSILDNVSLTLETETSSVRDKHNDIGGTDSSFSIEPGYKINSKMSVSAVANYKVRNFESEKNANPEDKNRDHLDEIYVKFLYKAAKFKDNGIADVRLQARVYSVQDDFFKRYYGNDGNYQFRAYFGRPLAGNFYINKYTSYVRYKKYLTNDYIGKYSRSYELRARISPTYRTAIKGLELGSTFTYNHVFEAAKAGTDSEKIDMDGTVRYSTGPYAVMFRVNRPLLSTDSFGNLSETDEADKKLGYALSFSAYL